MYRIATRTILILALAAGVAACSDEEAPAAQPTATPAAAAGPQRAEITVDAQGYHPDSVEGRVGQPITLVFRRTTDEGCGQELVVPSENIRRDLPLNQPVEITLTPGQAGRVAFTCGMNMLQGAVVVR